MLPLTAYYSPLPLRTHLNQLLQPALFICIRDPPTPPPAVSKRVVDASAIARVLIVPRRFTRTVPIVKSGCVREFARRVSWFFPPAAQMMMTISSRNTKQNEKSKCKCEKLISRVRSPGSA